MAFLYFYLMISPKEYEKLKYQTLNFFWGFEVFRENQEDIIDHIVEGKDTLVLLPTGGGKSLCYQLPALILEGTCIVVSPLLALMKDQVNQLKNKGIEAEFLSSEQSEDEAESILNSCKEGIVKLLYISPERLNNAYFLENIKEVNISFLAVDEAHCISEWGQDFRPSYQNIQRFREEQIHLPCIALTATATPKVLKEIQTKLNLKNPEIFQQSFKRNNIKIIADQVSDKYQRVFNLLKFNQNSGIIYTRTRKEAENLTHFLKNNGVENVDFFHAGLSLKEKNYRQNEWLKSNSKVLISTNAFGMGIDKENVQFVIHFSPSSSIENYYQEIGRAGRNGADSFAFLLWNEHEFRNFDDILKNQTPSKSEFTKIVTYLYSIFQIAENEQPENIFQMNVQRLKNITKFSSAKINNVLNFLHHQEIVYLNNYQSLSSIELKIKPEEIELLSNKDSYFVELLLRNLSGISTHKIYFSEQNLSNKLNADLTLVKNRIQDLQKAEILDYIDGSLSSIKFLVPRDDRSIEGKFWNLFLQIQKNKIQKWEEMKFFAQENNHCKMKMILHYFGEKTAKNCGNCSVCQRKKESIFGTDLSREITNILSKRASTVEEISIQLNFHKKEKILENLILLLDAGKVKMLNFRTYTLA